MRIVGIDFGEKRIGVAAGDDRLRLAVPVDTVESKGDPVSEIEVIAAEQYAEAIVVGMPLSLSGAEGPQAQRVREVVEELAKRLTIPVMTYDERLTTTEAARLPGGGSLKSKSGAASRDAIAASIMLQAYMDSRRPHD
ncbi:MAG TPA: Holliday junction resolvase RuvX [Dehalococcoidia bacterium]|nr:Holliday junction resolvase RuvX [Dehalococcoidia bacterium]